MIENHWLTDDLRNVMRLHFHGRVDFIGTLMEGIIAVRPDGRIVGANRSALEQLGMSGATLRMQIARVAVPHQRRRAGRPLPLAAGHAAGGAYPAGPRTSTCTRASIGRCGAAWPRPWPRRCRAPRWCRRRCVLAAAAEHTADSALLAMPDASARERVPLPHDAQVAAVVERLCRALERNIPSVLVGETGTGKEWLARAAHQCIGAEQPFVVLACAGLLPSAVEAALIDGLSGNGGAAHVVPRRDRRPAGSEPAAPAAPARCPRRRHPARGDGCATAGVQQPRGAACAGRRRAVARGSVLPPQRADAARARAARAL